MAAATATLTDIAVVVVAAATPMVMDTAVNRGVVTAAEVEAAVEATECPTLAQAFSSNIGVCSRSYGH